MHIVKSNFNFVHNENKEIKIPKFINFYKLIINMLKLLIILYVVYYKILDCVLCGRVNTYT